MTRPTTSEALLPLALPILLMTRPEAQARRFLLSMEERDARFTPIVSPLLRIEPKEAQVTAEALILTSVHGVDGWRRLGDGRARDAFVVGQATARAAREAGLEPRLVAGDADALVAALVAEPPGQALTHLHGEHRRGNIVERLRAAGIAAAGVVVYDQVQCPLNRAAKAALGGVLPVVAPVFSPRTAQILAQEKAQAPLLVAALSEAVAFNLAPLHIGKLKVAERPDSAAMIDAVAELLDLAHAGLT